MLQRYKYIITKRVTVKKYFSKEGNYFVVSRDLLQSAVNFAADVGSDNLIKKILKCHVYEEDKMERT
ncbi:hypothetical protein PRLR5107_31400 [Prevotella lacticifex]|uniref:Uncharacterized protein n=1 Tax=Prevotella lacticifex TaxID=2854755 RepID=A0A9R1C810_9BACT|nr:hypothetical protein PRLR5003_31450 [Prevotella lacticifex]GJG40785.1 hypothetical protein PRLR5019_27560 [Prevotella lacticifex]GJG43744.1 hypothetical protein PRLR5025_25300 [Prevotella lacticifex]GJG47524.1 hypothetical protein PRLR5027_31190 [Prevotella lacticifex]GJG49823.1 hypothetical protein PRLR5052_22360 [Prevotella lacticifex]